MDPELPALIQDFKSSPTGSITTACWVVHTSVLMVRGPSRSRGHDGPYRSLRRRESQATSSTRTPWQVPYLPESLWKPKSRASLSAQLVKNPPALQETLVQFLGREDLLEKGSGHPLQYSWASLLAQLVESACNAGDPGSIPGSGRSPGEGKGHLLQYSGLENSMGCIDDRAVFTLETKD